jgi:hypothetical protein
MYIYIYKTKLAPNEIFLPSSKIHREIGRAKDLSASLYMQEGHGFDSRSGHWDFSLT